MTNTITDHYARAVSATSLKSEPDTSRSNTDLLGAAAFAGHRLRQREDGSDRNTSPLAMALVRLFVGDNRTSGQIVELMANMSRRYADTHRIKLKRPQAEDIARAVLAWHRDGVCKPCGGHGFTMIPGTTTLSGDSCPSCKGTGRVPFERQFRDIEHLLVARWLLTVVEQEHSKAEHLARHALAPY